MKKRILSMLMASAMMAGVMAGCGKPADSGATADPATTPATTPAATPDAAPAADAGNADITIGIILKTLASEYWGYVEAGAKAAGEELGVKVEIVGAASETAFDEQMSMIETMLSSGTYDALTIAPLQPDMAAGKVADATIPILAVDTKIPADNVLTFIGTGNEEAAYQGGVYAAEQAIAAGVAKPTAVCISGVQGDTTAEARLTGYKKGFEEKGGTIIEVQYANAVADQALTVMESMLQKYPDGGINAVLCNNDDMAMAASRAAQQAGRENIIFMGFDGISSACQAILDGNETCSVAQSPYDMGYKSVELAIKAAKGEKLDAFYDTGSAMVTKENAQAMLDSLNAMLGK